MSRLNKNKAFIGVVVAFAALTVIVLSSEYLNAEEKSGSDDAVVIGTYQPQVVFQKHPARAELLKSLEDSRASMQEARQNADQEKMQKLQQEYEEKRSQVIDNYEKDLDETLPEIAKESGIDAVAVEITYKNDGVETTDLTSKIIEAFNEKYEKEGENSEEQPPMPVPVQ